MAGSHHLYPNEPWHSEGVYYFSANNKSIFYIVNEEKDKKEFEGRVIVTHVANSNQDLDTVLRNN